MHLGNGALTPECAALTAVAAAAGLGFAAYAARRDLLSPPKLLAAGVYGTFIFAAQMVNVPVLPYSSGHLVGGVLLAVALGPGLGVLVMAAVLALQVALLGDGGALALGANIINMGLIPAGLVAFARRSSPAGLSTFKQASMYGGLAVAATLLAATLIVAEVALFRAWSEIPLAAFAREMLVAHVVIGFLEGVLTAAIILAARGELLPEHRPAFFRRAGVACVAALLLMTVGANLASELDDGYEASADRSGWSELLD